MGYYSTMQGMVRIKKNKITAFKKALAQKIKEVKAAQKKQDCFGGSFIDYFFYEDEYSISEDGDLEYGDYHAKWYESDEFAQFIKPFVEIGTLEFVGDDGEKTGYEFDGKGKVFNLLYTVKRDSELK